MASSFNKVILMGNLTRDPELRTAGANGMKVASFGLAVNDSYRDRSGNVMERPVFTDVEVWDKQAENVAQYLRKGRLVLVDGRLQMDVWEKEGQRRTKLKVRAATVKFLPQPGPQQGQPQQDSPRQQDAQDILPF